MVYDATNNRLFVEGLVSHYKVDTQSDGRITSFEDTYHSQIEGKVENGRIIASETSWYEWCPELKWSTEIEAVKVSSADEAVPLVIFIYDDWLG